MIRIRSTKYALKWKQRTPHRILAYFRWSKLRWIVLISLFTVFIIQFYQIRSVTYPIFFRILINKYYSNYISLAPAQPPTTTNPPEILLDMNDRAPSYKLAIRPEDNTYVYPSRPQAKLLEYIQLYETCQQDPSTIVVHIGPFLGDFGLYAAACGCTVYIFEPQPQIVTLIHSSIKHNSFSSSRVRVFHNIVNHLPSNTTVDYPPGDGSPAVVDDAIKVKTIRLDDISWSSSSIFVLKVDADGYESNVFRSAEKLFAEKRIRHLIFRYHPWLTDRGSQETLLPYVKNELKAKFIYTLYRTDENIYGPLLPGELKRFYEQHVNRDLAADIYATFDDKVMRSTIKSKRYRIIKEIT